MGHGYKGNTGHYHSIVENLPKLKADYKYSIWVLAICKPALFS